ncbi:MAG: HDIG domain-containing protein [Spirochaetaceae bacterium]|jgi:putative nucleotidyltransferase with HDIG domain|nr:HDIG domain-containing protein [Spirochaetaceae bacterium]
MKKNNADLGGSVFFKTLKPSRLRPGPVLVSVIAFILSALVVIGGMRKDGGFHRNLQEFEEGKVAERDVSAEISISYIDEEATARRLAAQERLVPAVFKYDLTSSVEMRAVYERFITFSEGLFQNNVSLEAYQFAIQAEFPGAFFNGVLDVFFNASDRTAFSIHGLTILEHLIDTGIFALPQTGLEMYNPDMVELLHNSGSRTEREKIPFDQLLTKSKVREEVTRFVAGADYPAFYGLTVSDFLYPFIRENIFFSPEDTEQRLAEVRAKLEPVKKEIQRGEQIIRKGFIIRAEDMVKLRALNMSLSRRDLRLIIGNILILLLFFGLLVFLGSRRTVGRLLTSREVYFLSVLIFFYFTYTTLVSGITFEIRDFPVAILVPTALMVMLPSILIGFRMAVSLAMVLPLGAFLTGAFDNFSYIFALTSAVAASYVLQGAERRMDLVKAGLVIAVANSIAVVVILLLQKSPLAEYPIIIFAGAFNGICSGMLVLGFLPLMEHLLNAVTIFRLIELSDLNSPILKRLFTVAPGTYSHSVMVANLAESACQEIGANALLARVGAYYHDIGKMEQPDYFVENQTAYNKHDDIAPRLSATVIRSHVKLGVEKARCLGLPQEVMDIIAEHHGNSVISWFYHEALKRESQVNMEDFTYPGRPPRSRESAVVMLADVTEAAVRTLKKPTASKLEKFIQELIMAKVEHGQLAESELTFRDLESIKNAFVRVLAGYYHSRIEYPKFSPKEIPVPSGGRGASDGAYP